MEDATPGYDNTHRAFLQAFLARQTLTLSTAQPVLAALLSAADDSRPVVPADISQADLDSYIHTLNAAISPFDYEIRSSLPQSYKQTPPTTNGAGPSHEPAARQRIYALVNTTSDAPTQLATTHKPEEIAYVKRLLDAMFDTYNTPIREVMAVSSMDALNLARPRNSRASNISNVDDAVGVGAASSVGLTKTQAESVLKALMEEGWFVKISGYYTLSTRALLELRGWLRDTYNEDGEDSDDEGVERVKSCQACREIVTIGQRCGRRECKARLHEHCMDHFFRVQRSETCPLCKDEWTRRDYVGPKAAKARDRESGVAREEDG